ncbi:Peptidoglycan/LPS O-acetylase OafA/YrhL, contains acyltransferase and SGNH-hydrolase domains [Agrococcus baldri]|uniref:Peptidoglycan/LPS O-acetylase OafA/YrhL, contains acyltransferase and SGNH-hydrolase domains n=1 Tax=Agrococcus baldri TaxID=153730 RepID=A0AA94HN29_9MICO|nr:acyltransferase family protein [Agrococcus baldri]SFS14078.1 Peptidoglycan/LPS O-acetylase OafA/YrhL, contains acyltransferase and SGNH-hydrolase domains [Agrococcus baldri]
MTSVRERARGSASTAPQYIAEIQGLRTIALLMVAAFHIWFGRVSGGVDIFLIISAYLLTRSLTSAVEQHRGVQLVPFILRKFARLLPAAAAATLLALAGALLLLSQRHWQDLTDQALAAISYTMNFWLQSNAVDYLAQARSTASVFQHFWSLSVQGHMFILWPIIHVLVALLFRARVRQALLVAFSVIFLASFAWSVISVSVDQQLAYFDTWGRLWEFAAGSIFALIAPWLRLSTRMKHGMTWVGLAAVLATGWLLPVESAFPGFAALWPVVAAGLVLLAADAPGEPDYGGNAVLRHPVLERAGSYMYALYLTHWPALVLFAAATGIERPDPLQGLGILVVSGVASVLIYHGVEQPAARMTRSGAGRRGWLRQLVAIIVCVALVLGSVVGIRAYLERSVEEQAQQQTSLDLATMGANADPDEVFETVYPGEALNASFAQEPGEPCAEDDPYLAGICRDWGQQVSPERSFVIVGSSHSAAMSPALMEVIEQHPTWHVRTYTSPGCYFHWPADNAWPEEVGACSSTWRTAIDYILATSPDVVFTIASLTHPDGGEDLFTTGGGFAGFVDYLHERTGTLVVGLRDNPRADFSPLECAEREGYTSPGCAFRATLRIPGLADYASSIEDAGGLFIDLNDRICPGSVCTPALGGIVTFVDNSHIGEDFARSLAGFFAAELHAAARWYPTDPWG